MCEGEHFLIMGFFLVIIKNICSHTLQLSLHYSLTQYNVIFKLSVPFLFVFFPKVTIEGMRLLKEV